MSSDESSSGCDSQSLLRRQIRRAERLDVSVSPSTHTGGSEGDSEEISSSLRRPGQKTTDGGDISREENTPISALKRRKVETQSDLKTARARKESAEQARKREATHERKVKRKEQMEALKAIPDFGLGPGRCPSILLERHDNKPSSSTFKSIAALGDGKNWPRISFTIPGREDRPWAPPRGHLCVYECFFDQGGLGFPIPPVIMEYCARRKISISQLSHASFRNLMSILTLSYEAGRVVTCDHFEQACEIARGNSFYSGRFQIKMKSGLTLVTNFKNRLEGNWQEKYFFVEVTENSIGNYRGEIRRGWNRQIGTVFPSCSSFEADN